MPKFQNNVKAIRESKGWQQKDLATKANIRRQTIGEIESGNSETGVYRAQRVAKALRVSVAKAFPLPEDQEQVQS